MQDKPRIILWLERRRLGGVLGLVKDGGHGIDAGGCLRGVFEDTGFASFG